jgi:hypothetical protein
VPGGHQLPDPQLPWVSPQHQRRGAHLPRPGAGVAVRGEFRPRPIVRRTVVIATGSPGGAWASPAWRRSWVPGCSTAWPGPRRAPCWASTSSWSGPGTPPARPRSTWPGRRLGDHPGPRRGPGREHVRLPGAGDRRRPTSRSVRAPRWSTRTAERAWSDSRCRTGPAARPRTSAAAALFLPGVFAVGDVRYRSVKRVGPAVGAGAITGACGQADSGWPCTSRWRAAGSPVLPRSRSTPMAGSRLIRQGGCAKVHVLLRNPQVELVPCRRRPIGPA